MLWQISCDKKKKNRNYEILRQYYEVKIMTSQNYVTKIQIVKKNDKKIDSYN